MVRELTELQGTMGGIYAREAGEPEAVWKAIYHHYQPVGVESHAAPQPDALGPARLTWAAVSLADKLDTLVGLFLAGERPTGSRDPFGLRRQAHGILRLLLDAGPLAGVRVRTPIDALLLRAAGGFGDAIPAAVRDQAWPELSAFLVDRLQHAFEIRGGDRRNIRAVLAGPEAALGTAVADQAANLDALPAVARADSFRQLATAFKRVRNIAREYTADAFAADEAQGPALGTLLVEPAEQALLAEVEARGPAIANAVREGAGYREAYAEAAAFEPVVGRFFDEVFVMTDDQTLRRARLRLMKRLETVILQLGDISEIVTTES
jgi:glycyl-tRNA synthetase beta chain